MTIFVDSVGGVRKSADTADRVVLRLRVRRGEDGDGENDGEGGEDSISNSPQGECYIKLSGGGGGAAALHTTNRVKSASDGNAHWRAMRAASWRRGFTAGAI